MSNYPPPPPPPPDGGSTFGNQYGGQSGDQPGGQSPPNNSMGTAALVVGILAIVFGVLFFPLGALLGVVAIVLGVLGRGKASRGEATNRGQATAGLICGSVGLVIAIALGVIVGNLIFDAVDEVEKCNELPTQEQRDACIGRIGQ